MQDTILNRYRRYLTVCIVFLFCYPVVLFSQSTLCTGTLGNPTIFKDFGSGSALYNTAPASTFGFSTTFTIWNKPKTDDGFYSIVNSIPADFQINNRDVWHTGAQDHTAGDVNGYMLLVNGDQNLGEFYRDTATGLCTGATYEFSSYLANLFMPASTGVGASNPPVVRFEIRDLLGNVLHSVSTGNVPTTAALTWTKYGITFNAPSPQVVLVMVSTAPAGTGNDIVIDDIAFTPCLPNTTNITPLATVCENGDSTFTVNVLGNADFKYSQWQKSSDKGVSWNYLGSPAIQSSILASYALKLPLSNIPLSDDSTMYRLILTTDASYFVNPISKCNVISDTSLLVVNKYPILAITDPDTVCSQKVDLTLAAITVGSTFPLGTKLTYHTSQANANNGVNAMTTAAAKAIANSGTYYIRAATNTIPACADVEAVKVVIEPLKKLTLTAPLPMCKDSAIFMVNATKTNITNLSWVKSSTGAVLQSGAANMLTVTPTVADLAKDSIWIIVTSTDVVIRCPNLKDSVKAVFYNPPTVQAPNDTSFCLSSSSQTLPLKATFNASNGVVWSTSSTLVTPNPATGKATSLMIKGALDEKIYITASTKGCRPVKDSVRIKTEVIDTIKITGPVKVCRNNPIVDASIKTSSLAGIAWQGNGGAFSPNTSNLTIVYTPTSSEIITSLVKLKAVTLAKPAQLCPVVADSIKVGVFVEPTLDLPSDTSLCFSNNPTPLTLNSVLSNADSLVWRTDNVIVPIPKQGANTLLNITNNSTFKVIGTAYKKGCVPIKDSLLVSLETQPKVTAVATDTCSADLRVKLSGTSTLTGAKGKATWTSSGLGTFKLNVDSLTANAYFPTKADSILGSVKLILTSRGQTYCKADSVVLNHKIIPLPKANAGTDTTVCQNSSVTKSTQTNTDWMYQWRTAKNGTVRSVMSTYSLAASHDTNVYISVKNSIGCLAEDSSKIFIEVPPKVTAAAMPTCQNDLRVLLNGTSSLNLGKWTSGGTGSFIDLDNVLVNNGYVPSKLDSTNKTVNLILTSTGQVHCPKDDTTIVWQIIPLPKASAGNDSVVCINSSINRFTSSNSDWKYEWRFVKSGSLISSLPSIGFSVTKDTNNLYLTVINSRNCTAVDSAQIVTITPPILSLPPKICFYAPKSVSATVTNPPDLGKYVWKRGNDTLSEPSNTLLIDTVSTYTYNFSFDGGCFSSDTIVALKPPKLVVPDTAACQNALTAFIANQITGANYYWGPSAVTNGTNKFPINAGSGVSNFKVLVIDTEGCRDSVLANVSIVPYPNFSLSGADLCPGESKKLMTTLVQPSLASTYTLSSDWKRNGSPISATDWQELTYNQAGNYSLTLGIKGCTVSNSYVINFNPVPKIDIPLTYKHCFETDAPLNLQSNPFAKYAWRTDDGLVDSIQTIKVNPEKDTYYYLNVKNTFGCKDSSTIFVRKVCPPRLFVPNVITPESNDVNAALRIFGANYTNFEITIFSRWGEVIFNSKDPQHAWNGEYINEKMPIGNYQWLVTYEGDTEEYKGPYKKTGDVAVVR